MLQPPASAVTKYLEAVSPVPTPKANAASKTAVPSISNGLKKATVTVTAVTTSAIASPSSSPHRRPSPAATIINPSVGGKTAAATGKPVSGTAAGKPVSIAVASKAVSGVAAIKSLSGGVDGKPVSSAAAGKPISSVAASKPVSGAAASKPVSGATAAPSVVRQTQLLLLQKTAGITGGRGGGNWKGGIPVVGFCHLFFQNGDVPPHLSGSVIFTLCSWSLRGCDLIQKLRQLFKFLTRKLKRDCSGYSLRS